MKSILIQTAIVLLFIFASTSFASAQVKKRLKDTNGGYSFLPPDGFESKQNEEGFALVNSAQSVILIVKAHKYTNLQQFANEANLEKDGFTLVGKIQDFGENGKTFRASKQNAQGTLIADTFVSFSPHSGGVLVVALSDAKNAEKGFQKGLEISNSLNFSKPTATAGNSQLENAFRGKHLLYLYTASGFSERTDIYLCSSGAFIFKANSSSLSANGSGAVDGNSDGKWKILSSGNNASLILQFNNGSTRQYSISARQANNEIGLNGKRFFVQNHNQCR
jgi:hypothetical protein